VESGKRSDRPEFAKALAACRLHRATLVIAKLDRLARKVHFVFSLMESGVEFVAADNPHANKLTIQILVAMAEHEAEMISARTKAGCGKKSVAPCLVASVARCRRQSTARSQRWPVRSVPTSGAAAAEPQRSKLSRRPGKRH
jgi:hypothetical protein